MNQRRLIVVVPHDTEVTLLRPGARTLGLRANALVVDRDAMVGSSPTEQATLDDWLQTAVLTRLVPHAPTIIAEYD